MTDYLIATVKPWNIAAYERHARALPGTWHLVTDKDQLTAGLIQKLKPRYIFFPHWSWVVPDSILNNAECVCFHMADVPYGRGGSPLQNLIERSHKDTKLTALRMVKELDAGPVYLKRPLSLAGRAQDIFDRMADLSYEMMAEIVKNEPEPSPQEGKATVFKRRTPEMSALPKTASIEQLYDHIRMLDAETYPHAFLDHGDFRIEFKNAKQAKNGLTAEVSITRKEKP